MLILLIILLFFLTIFLWILFAPLYLQISTEKAKYAVFIPGIFSFKMTKKDEKWLPKIRVLFIPLDLRKRREKNRDKGNEIRKKINIRISNAFSEGYEFLKKFLRSFKIKRFELNIDTGDYTLNSYLIPVAVYTSGGKANFQVNYNNYNRADILISGKTYKILYYFIKFYFRHK